MKVVMMDIGPEDARELLGANITYNRPLNRYRVAVYARAMKQGRWHTTHQGIALTPEMKLLDGQHRLAAIIESGVTVKIPVWYDVPEGTWLGIDALQPKRPHTLTGTNRHVAAAASAAARLVLDNSKTVTDPWILQVFTDLLGPVIEKVNKAAARQKPAGPGHNSIVIQLAVALRMMTGHDVLEDYRAFSHLDYTKLSVRAASFLRQIQRGIQYSSLDQQQKELLARAWMTFDAKRSGTEMLMRDRDGALEEVRQVIVSMIPEEVLEKIR